MKSEHSVEIHIPSDTDMTAVRIEGSKDGVARAKAELMELVDKMVSSTSSHSIYLTTYLFFKSGAEIYLLTIIFLWNSHRNHKKNLGTVCETMSDPQ